jgi:uncharacterized BrkB/YihY/UPF0761 family membrane protein
MPEDRDGADGGAGPSSPPAEPSGPDGTAAKRTLRERTGELRTRAEAARRALGTRAGDLQERHETVRVAFAAYDRDRRQAGGLLAGGLAFRLFLWLLPTSLLVVSVIRLVSDASSRSPQEVAETTGFGAALAAAVAEGARASGSSAAWLAILGLVLMLWAGVGLVKALRLLAGVAWQIRPTPLRHTVRTSAIAAGVTLGLLAIPLACGPLYAGGVVSDLLASLLTIAAFASVFTWVMTKLPRPDGSDWLRLVPGALLMAVGLELLRLVTSVYFVPRLGRTSDLYGALGLAAVFLAWLYLIGRILVAGFALNAELWRARHRAGDDGADTDEGPTSGA